jgi:hypothetical protein
LRRLARSAKLVGAGMSVVSKGASAPGKATAKLKKPKKRRR